MNDEHEAIRGDILRLEGKVDGVIAEMGWLREELGSVKGARQTIEWDHDKRLGNLESRVPLGDSLIAEFRRGQEATKNIEARLRRVEVRVATMAALAAFVGAGIATLVPVVFG